MGNEFGQRQAITRDTLRSIQGVSPAAARDDGVNFFSSPLWRQLRGMLIGIAIVGLLVAVYIATMKGFGRALDQHWAQYVGYPSVEDAYARSGAKDTLLEQVHNDCKSRSDFVGRNKPKTMNDVVSADGITKGRAATYVSCLAAEKPKRLCQAVHRSHLLAAVRDYYRLLAKMREEHVMMNGGPFAANRALMGGPVSETFPSTSPMAMESDPRVIEALKTLVSNGYLPRRDLIAAAGRPSDLEVALRGVEPKQKGCG